ncbi:enoyl-CoA hydratase-related protein [Thermodesulfobacteriota bacterium]
MSGDSRVSRFEEAILQGKRREAPRSDDPGAGSKIPGRSVRRPVFRLPAAVETQTGRRKMKQDAANGLFTKSSKVNNAGGGEVGYENVIYETADRVAKVTLNRPEHLNALSSALLTELVDALREAENDEDVRVVIIKGAGRAFCAGYDIQPGRPGEYVAGRAPIIDDLYSVQGVTKNLTVIWDLHKPVIAQVHGYCVAGGNDIAGQCDITIAAENAMFMHPQVRRLGLTWLHMAAYHAGLQWAKMMMFTGDPVSGKQAEQIGLVAKAVPEGRLEEEVNKLAKRIACVPSELLALNKAALNRVAEEMGLTNYFHAASALDTVAHYTKPVLDFIKMTEQKGLREALAENEAPFKKLPKPFVD